MLNLCSYFDCFVFVDYRNLFKLETIYKKILDLFIIFYSAVPKLRKFFFLYSYIKYSSRASRRMSNTFDNSHQFTSILFHFHPFLRIHMSDAQTLKWEHFFSFIFIYIFFCCSVWNEEENVECERINVPRPTWLLYTQRAHTENKMYVKVYY